jgi:hypothetical protein
LTRQVTRRRIAVSRRNGYIACPHAVQKAPLCAAWRRRGVCQRLVILTFFYFSGSGSTRYTLCRRHAAWCGTLCTAWPEAIHLSSRESYLPSPNTADRRGNRTHGVDVGEDAAGPLACQSRVWRCFFLSQQTVPTCIHNVQSVSSSSFSCSETISVSTGRTPTLQTVIWRIRPLRQNFVKRKCSGAAAVRNKRGGTASIRNSTYGDLFSVNGAPDMSTITQVKQETSRDPHVLFRKMYSSSRRTYPCAGTHGVQSSIVYLAGVQHCGNCRS